MLVFLLVAYADSMLPLRNGALKLHTRVFFTLKALPTSAPAMSRRLSSRISAEYVHLPQGNPAFLGLGAMGYPMAANIRSKASDGKEVMVWNRTRRVIENHVSEHQTTPIDDSFAELSKARTTFLCLPTSKEVKSTLQMAAPKMQPGSVVVDCTSGDPTTSRWIANWLLSEYRIHFVDCAVSGGPAGAAKGTVAAFVGCDNETIFEQTRELISTFARKIVYLGPASSGHATKSVNNVLNVSNLCVAAEGLLALKKLGVDPAKALSVINAASGRSLMSKQRLPEEVLTGDFDYGFKLGLMRKDVRIANDLLDTHFEKATMFRETLKLIDAALGDLEDVNGESDYTCVVKALEHRADSDLRSDTHIEYEKK